MGTLHAYEAAGIGDEMENKKHVFLLCVMYSYVHHHGTA